MGLSRSFALPVGRGSCRAVTPFVFHPCFIRVSSVFQFQFSLAKAPEALRRWRAGRSVVKRDAQVSSNLKLAIGNGPARISVQSSVRGPMQLTAGETRVRVLPGSRRRRGPFAPVAGNCAGPLSSPPDLPLGKALLSPTLSSHGGRRGRSGMRASRRRCGQPRSEAAHAFGLLMRSQDGLHCETNSLSLRSGERARVRGNETQPTKTPGRILPAQPDRLLEPVAWAPKKQISRHAGRMTGVSRQARWCFERCFPLTPPSPLGRGRISRRAFANPERLDSPPRGIRCSLSLRERARVRGANYEIVFRQCFQGFPLSPALSPLVPRGEREKTKRRLLPVPLSPILRTPLYLQDSRPIGLGSSCEGASERVLKIHQSAA